MTNLRDLLNDLITETIETAEKHASCENVYISEEEKEVLLDEYIEIIKNRIVG